MAQLRGRGKAPAPPPATSTEDGQNPLISHSGREPHPWGEGEGGDRGGSHNPPTNKPGHAPAQETLFQVQKSGEVSLGKPPPLIVFETAPTPANLIIDLIDLGEGPSGAKQGEGEETLAPPLIPEIVPINVENTRDSGVDPKTRGVTKGEVGKSDPPAPGHPEGSQPHTDTLLGTGPDPGEDGAKDRPRPPPRGKGGERPNQPHQYGK